MKMKRFLVFLLAFCFVIGHFSFIHAKAETTDVWSQIAEVEEEAYAPRRGTASARDVAAAYVAVVDDIIDIVQNSGDYQDGSLEQHGAFFYWKDANGMTNCYSPTVRANMKVSATGGTYSNVVTWSPEDEDTSETKASKPSTLAVGIIQPFYGIDSSFTEEYFETAKEVAKKTGGSCAAYRGSAVTIDVIASLLKTCGVVIFDSHGSTDYTNPYDSDDCTSQANTSYLVINSDVGLTDELYATSHQGTYGTYYDVCSGGYDEYGNHVMFVNGTAIANHMSAKAPSSLLWIGICLGMATDGLYLPLRNKGVEVVCGYSQSVTFKADYAWKDAFFAKLISGGTVKTASAYMKQQVGNYDPYVYYYPAYPIVVSTQDAYPGQGYVDAVQTVASTWKLALTTTASPAIKMQPQNQSAVIGDEVDFSVVVAGTPTKYQWQVNKGSSWTNINTTSFPSAKTSILTFTVKETMGGYKYRCKVTFDDGTVKYTSAATLTIKTSITKQPQDTDYIKPGNTASFSVTVSGPVTKYQWQVSKSYATWTDISTTKYPSAKTKKLSFTASKAMNGYGYRCVITCADGSQLISDPAYLNIYGIVETYRSAYYYNEGETAYIAIFAARAKSYQWQVSKDGGSTWTNISKTSYPSAGTDCLEFTCKTSMDGYRYRCKVTFDDGTTKVTSDACLLNVFGISKQPVAKSVTAGKKATFTVTVNNTDEVYGYQWQVSKDGGKTWTDISTSSYPSAATATLSFTAKAAMNGYYYRCRIESWYSYGYIYTNKVKLTVK